MKNGVDKVISQLEILKDRKLVNKTNDNKWMINNLGIDYVENYFKEEM